MMIKKGLLTALLSLLVCINIHANITKIMQGKELYENACSNCHSPKKAKGLRAPPAFDKVIWQKLKDKAALAVKNGEFKSVDDYLIHQVKIGRGLMHHGGLCRESKSMNKALNCSHADYLAAIEYMSERKQ